MYGWPLLGNHKFGSRIWGVAARYSAPVYRCISAHLDEVRMYQVRSVERNLVA